jgi:hypothetical protein
LVLPAVAAVLVACAADPAALAEPASAGDYGTNMVRCLSAKGWDVQRTADGGFDAKIPVAQTSRYNADREACKARFGYNDELSVTPEMAGHFYDRLVAAAECLRRLGYDISDPPSRQSYVETLVGGALPDWTPYYELMELAGPVEFQQAQAACPQPTSW